MNSMRLLILLTLIVYETKCAPSIKPLKFLKSLISKHLPSTTEQPLLEDEIYTAYKCESDEEGAINDADIEWNHHVFLVNEKPVLIEVGNVEQIQNVNQNEDLTVSPEINSEVNCEENPEVNPELNSEEERKNVYEKDLNTQWLLGENTSEKLPEIDVGTPSIKDKIINKINIIKSKLKLMNRLVIPISESVEENNNNVDITSVKPISTLEPITTGKPISTLEPTTTGKPTTAQHITTVQPVTTTHQYTTTMQPLTSTQPAVSVQYTTSEKPESSSPNVLINGVIESQEPIVTIPIQNQMALQPQQIYYSDTQYPLWFNNCPPPQSHQICYHQYPYYAPNPIFANTWNANQLTLENLPYNTPTYQNQKSNNGLTKVINYINIDATQPANPIKPNQDEPWIRYANENSKLIYENPISYYIPQTANPESQPEIVFPSSEGVYSTSTMEPIVVYSADASILPTEQVDQTQPKFNWDQLLAPATVNSNVEGSQYPFRGDIPFGEDLNPIANNNQPEEDGSIYKLKERRNVGHYNNDKKLTSQENNLKVPFQASEIALDKPVSERAETETPSNKTEIPTVTETKTLITKIETPVAKIEKPVTKIEKPIVKIETPAVALTETPHPKSNNVNVDV